jgi:hypothetical protein
MSDSDEVEHEIDPATAASSPSAATTSPSTDPNEADNGSDSKIRSRPSEA